MNSESKKFKLNLQGRKLPGNVLEMIESSCVEKYVAEYNRRMAKVIKEWEPMPPLALKEDAAMARAVENMWLNETEVTGSVDDILSLTRQAREYVALAESNDVERYMDNEEIMRRFLEFGVDVEAVRQQCETFYFEHEYGNLLEGYELPYPKMTEGNMQKIEQLFLTKEVDTVFFDDRRVTAESIVKIEKIEMDEVVTQILTDGKVLPANLLEGYASKRGAKKSLTTKDIKGMRKESRGPSTGIALVVTKLRSPTKPKDRKLSFIAAMRQSYDLTPLELGTYLRLEQYLAENNPEGWETLMEQESGNFGPALKLTIINAATQNGSLLRVVKSGKNYTPRPFSPTMK